MAITLEIPRVLTVYSGGESELVLEAKSVRAALEQVQLTYPKLYPSLCDETGKVRVHLNLFVNSDLINKQSGLDAQLRAGDVVSVFQAVSGG